MSNKNSGLSLIETIVGIGIFTIAITAITIFIIQNYQVLRRINQQIEAQNQARKAIKMIISELRNANLADTGAYTIESATLNSLTFFSNIDSQSDRERIRYFLEENNLKKGVIKPSGNPLKYDPINENISVAARYTRNLSFAYYDGNYTGVEPPLASPINVTKIKMVKVSLTIDVDPHTTPPGFTLESEVNLRNLKENL